MDLIKPNNTESSLMLFAELGGSQCGFCTPGMIMSTYALFLENPDPTEEEARLSLWKSMPLHWI